MVGKEALDGAEGVHGVGEVLAVCRRHEDELRGGGPADLGRVGVDGEAEARQVAVRHVEYRPVAVTIHLLQPRRSVLHCWLEE